MLQVIGWLCILMLALYISAVVVYLTGAICYFNPTTRWKLLYVSIPGAVAAAVWWLVYYTFPFTITVN